MVAVWRINSLAHEWARETCQEAISIVQMRYGGDGSGDRENRFDKYVWGKVGGIGKTFTKWGRDSQEKRRIKKSLKF